MDIVFIQGLKIDCVSGIYDWEREIRQQITLDIEMSADNKATSEPDAVT
jgi:dihydroneopterin aldolase